ncbi:phosphopantetheine-binding protein [Desulfopila inferna]|uniref:phosphopantetheine-binding protein n=1 Tax=Desulfopila inferna TaxID=468528 RepID=UPI00196475E4|nr:phosphopantetheine-binding protein [Desulfopila inferna]MBM9604302.1 acyl carrier protein [Desulfopila inferna]
MEPFERELLELIITTCNLSDIEVDKIANTDPLIGPDSPLGTDSLDALEIAVAVQHKYGVRMDSENTSRLVLQSLATLAEYIKKDSGNATGA